MAVKWIVNAKTPDIIKLSCFICKINNEEKRDHSAKSLFHWKVLKCRMLIFTNPMLIASPDLHSDAQIIIIFPKEAFTEVSILEMLDKFGITKVCEKKKVDSSLIETCFSYTLRAKIAPLWNVIGTNMLIKGRNFLMDKGPLGGVSLNVYVNAATITMEIIPKRVRFPIDDHLEVVDCMVTILPSLNKARAMSLSDKIPESCLYRNYRELQRHWKNVHGYRLPNEEQRYAEVLFWRGPPLTYPVVCIKSQPPIVTPALPQDGSDLLNVFLSDLRMKMPMIFNYPLIFHPFVLKGMDENHAQTCVDRLSVNDHDTSYSQNISLCTPTQNALQETTIPIIPTFKPKINNQMQIAKSNNVEFQVPTPKLAKIDKGKGSAKSTLKKKNKK